MALFRRTFSWRVCPVNHNSLEVCDHLLMQASWVIIHVLSGVSSFDDGSAVHHHHHALMLRWCTRDSWAREPIYRTRVRVCTYIVPSRCRDHFFNSITSVTSSMARTKQTARKLPVGGIKTPRQAFAGKKVGKRVRGTPGKKRRWRPGTVAVSLFVCAACTNGSIIFPFITLFSL